MSSLADLSAELDDSAPAARKQSLAGLADELAPQQARKAAPAQPPKFSTNDPASMRRRLAESGDPAVLAVFDRMFPDVAAQATAAPAPPAQQAPPGQIPTGMGAGGQLLYGGAPPGAPDKPESLWDKLRGTSEAAAQVVSGATQGAVGAAGGLVSGLVRAVKAGTYGTPQGAADVDANAAAGARALTYQPPSQAGQRYAGNVGEAAQTLTPLAPMAGELGALAPALRDVGDAAKSATGGGRVAGAAPPRIEPTFSQPKPVYRQVEGQWQATGEVREPHATPTPSAQDVATKPAPAAVTFDSPPVEGGLPKVVVPERADVLKRIGLESVRRSAVNGDAAAAAQDYQVSRFTSEPAGLAAKAQFDAERQALAAHGERTVSATGGTLGLDQDAINARGQTIAAPFDALRGYFETQKKAAYTAADKAAGGAPAVNPEGLRALLADPDFTETLLAKGQGAFLDSVKRQLERFIENRPDAAPGMSVQSAEKLRQWLNKTWSPETNGSIGALKGALDEDVFKAAGANVYEAGRGLHALEKQTLDNPSGVSRLMDFDPHTPINRVTPYDKIPDRLTGLPPAQFQHVVDTLKSMPAELQPQARAALAEIQAHYANKALDAGGNNKGQWNAKKVSDFRRANNANISLAFGDNPQAMGMLDDLQSAGHILDYPSSYPGAAAQAAQALKRGLMSNIVERGGSYVGAGVGSLFGPVGGAGGSAVGGAIGARAGAAMGEKAALKRWQTGVTRLSDVGR